MTVAARVRAAIAARRPLLAVVPTRRLAIAVACLAPLWLVPSALAAQVAAGALGALALVAAADIAILPGRRDLHVARELPDRVGLGDPAEGRYTIRSAWPGALRITVADLFPGPLQGGLGVRTVAVTPHSGVELSADLTGTVRGEWAPGPIALRIRTKLGLVARRIIIPDDTTVLVAPSLAGVRRYRLLALQHRLQSAGVRALRQRGEGSAFAGLREYVMGDDPRRLDWKATARRRKFIVREFTIERSQTVITLVDAGRSMTQLAGQYPRFEHALSSALVLTDVAATAGDYVGTLVFDDQIRAFVPPQRGRAALRAVRDAMFPVRATLAEPDYASAFRLLALRQRKRALIVFFTDVLDVRASHALLAQLVRSSSRHLALVVALRNDALFAAAESRGTSAAALYEQAVAEELILARAAALERMRRAGVVVLDVSPQVMTAALINRYLEIKTRGAL